MVAPLFGYILSKWSWSYNTNSSLPLLSRRHMIIQSLETIEASYIYSFYREIVFEK